LGVPIPEIVGLKGDISPRCNNLGAGISQKLSRHLELAGAAELLSGEEGLSIGH
jgi:hypothetical protein